MKNKKFSVDQDTYTHTHTHIDNYIWSFVNIDIEINFCYFVHSKWL